MHLQQNLPHVPDDVREVPVVVQDVVHHDEHVERVPEWDPVEVLPLEPSVVGRFLHRLLPQQRFPLLQDLLFLIPTSLFLVVPNLQRFTFPGPRSRVRHELSSCGLRLRGETSPTLPWILKWSG